MSLSAVPNAARRLTEEQIRTLEQKLGALAFPIVNSGTTELEAGHRLGVQYVLQLLRNGW